MFCCKSCCVVGDPGMTEKVDADSVFMEMICPTGTNPDDSPLYVLCCNDTCSFTWTGAEHINQVRDTHTKWVTWEDNATHTTNESPVHTDLPFHRWESLLTIYSLSHLGYL